MTFQERKAMYLRMPKYKLAEMLAMRDEMDDKLRMPPFQPINLPGSANNSPWVEDNRVWCDANSTYSVSSSQT